MKFDQQTLDDLTRKLGDALPPQFRALQQDMEQNFRAVLQAGLTKLDLVTRQEFDVRAGVLARTREKLEAMEKLIREQGEAAARQQAEMQAEIHDLRAQLHQTETRLKEAMRALPAPEATPAPKAPGFFARLKKGNR